MWGLWNSALEEWWNPGTRQPYFISRDQAHHMLPLVLRQYGYGHWEVREYPLDDEAAETPATAVPTRPAA